MSTETYNQQPVTPPTTPQPIPPAVPPTYYAQKSPGGAALLSSLPGVGHLYLGLYQRAMGIFFAFAGMIWITDRVDAAGILVAGVWFFGVVDAYRQAQNINAGLPVESLLGGVPKRVSPRSGTLGFGVVLLILGVLAMYEEFYGIDWTFLEHWWPMILMLPGVYLIAKHFIDKSRAAKENSTETTL